MNGNVTGRAILCVTRLLRFAIEWLLNGLGFPGFLYDKPYVALNSNTSVSGHRGPFCTVVTINGLDIYFHRLTGKIDGIGFNPASYWRVAATPKSIDLGAVPVGAP